MLHTGDQDASVQRAALQDSFKVQMEVINSITPTQLLKWNLDVRTLKMLIR